MNKIFLPIIATLLLAACNKSEKGIPYTTDEWNFDSLGYHRVVIEVKKESDAVIADIPWRRHDTDPGSKLIRIFSKETGGEISNIFPVDISNERGEFIFQPAAGKGTYYIYWLPGIMKGRSNYPKVEYPPADYRTDRAWVALHNLTDSVSRTVLPEAKVTSFQSSDSFNSFYPMEVIATHDEVETLRENFPEKSYFLFPEDRFHSIRMTDYLPERWIGKGPFGEIEGTASRGEYFTFQVGLYSPENVITGLVTGFSDITARNGDVVIPAANIASFNTGGTGWDGKPFSKNITVEAGKVQPLWFGMMIPEDFPGGKLRGNVTIKPAGMQPETLPVIIDVGKEIIEQHGDNDPARMTRLRWLNSTKGLDNDLIEPFTEIDLSGNTLSLLGREIVIGNNGLPSAYRSYFNNNNTAITSRAVDVLAAPVAFNITRSDGSKVFFNRTDPVFSKEGSSLVTWKNSSESRDILLSTSGSLEADGFSSVMITLKAKKDVRLDNIDLIIPYRKDHAVYMMGLGLRGGKRPYWHNWKWDLMKHQEGAWIGGVNGGIQFALRDDKYKRPLNTNFYREKPLVMPRGWYNEGRGGMIISTEEYSARARAFTGSMSLTEDEEVVFVVNFLFTPFKTIDTDWQWNTRFYHRYELLDTILAYGANTVNVHHATEINPWINYPFLEQEKMKSYIDSAHARGMKVKIYNTVRELSNRAPEIFAIRSLGHEIFSPGDGGGFNWLQEHLDNDYIAAWFVPKLKDAAIINSGMSRWLNYYIEGMDWLARNMEIDGIYIDDVAFDRTTMKRLRKMLDNNREAAIIDLHSANQYNVRDGFTNSAYLYMEHFPYINRLWFGEYFDKELPPDFWLVEMSGIPFGLMGEMLQDGGNQYRGLLYGMTSRAPWSGDPRNIWSLWDSFGMEGTEFTGYWDEESPVKTGYRTIPASVYSKDDSIMVVIASWNSEKKNVWLQVDWDALGINRKDAIMRLPYIRDFQEEAEYRPWEAIPIKPGKGAVVILSNESMRQ